MKEFDLEAAKRGEPIVCRDGTPAKFIAHVPESIYDNDVLVLIEGRIERVTDCGLANDGYENEGDLFMAPKKSTVWVNIYGTSATVYCSEHDADRAANPHRIGNRAYRLEIQE
jgi:hypothetical protein